MLQAGLKFFVIFVSGVLLQGSVFPMLLPFVSAPDFLLILVLWISLTYDDYPAIFGSFLLGLTGDFASGLYLGPQALGSLLACILIRGISRHVYADQFLSVALVALLASFVKQISGLLLILSFKGLPSFFNSGFGDLLFQALSTALIGALLLKFIFLRGRRTSRSRSAVRRL